MRREFRLLVILDKTNLTLTTTTTTTKCYQDADTKIKQNDEQQNTAILFKDRKALYFYDTFL